MIDIVRTETGVVIPVRVQPGAARNRVIGEYGGRLKLAITAAPEKGKANKVVRELLADAFRINESSVEIVSGKSSRDKRVVIHGISHEAVQSLLNC